jgi:hypothetical protein
MNIWGIPDWLEREVRARDKMCVYCGIEMLTKVPRGRPRKAAALGNTLSMICALLPART